MRGRRGEGGLGAGTQELSPLLGKHARCTSLNMYVHVRVRTRAFMYAFVYVCVCLRARMRMCVCLHLRACVRACMHACVPARARVHILAFGALELLQERIAWYHTSGGKNSMTGCI